MRGNIIIRAVLAALFVMLGVTALAQDAAQLIAPKAAPAPGPIVLSGQQGSISLDRTSRYWIDATETYTPDQVEARGDSLPWAVRQPGQSYNLDGRALWLQFDVINPGGQRWFVETLSSGIDRVQLFYRDAGGRWVTQEAGDTRPVSMWPLPGRFPTFELVPSGQQPMRYWMRIEHRRVDFASPLNILNQSRLIASRELEQFLLGGYFALATVIVLVAAANALAFRDRNFAIYAVYVGALAAGQAAYLGVGAQHIWDDWLEWNAISTLVLPGLSSAAALWFAKTVTEPARYSRALDLAVWGLIAAILSAVAMDIALPTRNSFTLLVVLTTLAVLVVALLVILVWKQGQDPFMRWIALGFLPVLVMALFPLARGLNLIPVSLLTRYGLIFGAAVELPVLFYALTLRGSRRREAQIRASALARTDAVTGLANTRTLTERLDNAIARASSLKHACALLAVRIANFETIADAHGRETAERVLVVTASLLRRASTDTDMAARVGDHDFALLLDGPSSTEAAISRAQQIVASGLRSSKALPPETVLKFQVTVAMLPDQNFDAAGGLRWLLEGVAAMGPDTRKLIRPLNF